MRKLKKGFTIIELVIVIAVIAVLTAVLVPTFVHLSKKARDTNDKSIVTSANIQLAAQEGLQGKNRSMSEAVKDVDEIGYHMSTVPTGNGNKIVWDSVTDRFVLLDKDNNPLLSDGEVSSHDKLFYAVSSLDERGDFAVYAKSGYSGTTAFTSETGIFSFDAGDKDDIEEISYTFSTAENILVVTNSEHTTLNVNAGLADFKHVGLCGSIIISDVAPDTFIDHGHVGYVQIDAGHYVAGAGADVKTLFASTNNAKVDQENGGKIGAAYGASPAVLNEGHNVVLITDSGKTAEQVQTAGVNALIDEINPSTEPVRIGINPDNYLTVMASNPTNSYYVLESNLTLPSVWYIDYANVNVDLIDIDLNGFAISCSTGGTLDLLSCSEKTFVVRNGTINNDHYDFGNSCGICGGGFTLVLDNIQFTGSNTYRVASVAGSIIVRSYGSSFNGGFISVFNGTVILDSSGEFNVAYIFYKPITVTTTDDYEIVSEVHTSNPTFDEEYITYTVAKRPLN